MGRHRSERLNALFALEPDCPPLSMFQGIRTQAEIRSWLATHQKRLQAGELLPTLSEIAGHSRISRETLYQVIHGEHIGATTQRRLSFTMNRIERALSATASQQKPKLAFHVSVTRSGPRLSLRRGM